MEKWKIKTWLMPNVPCSSLTIIVVRLGTSTFPSLPSNSYLSLGTSLYPLYLPLLPIAKRCPRTYHDEHHRCLFLKCRLADAGARRRWHPGPFDDRSLCASTHVFGYITFVSYFSRIGSHYHFIQHPTPKQQGEKIYHTICASPPTVVPDRL